MKNNRSIYRLGQFSQNVAIYNVNPTKTTVTVYPGRRSYIPDTSHVWNLCDEEVTPTDDHTHLGIIRSAGKLTPDIQKKISMKTHVLHD